MTAVPHLLLNPLVIQLALSLPAILLVAWLVGRLGLGGDLRIRSEDQARALANSAICGFDPVDLAIDRAGIGVLARDARGRVLLLRRHGAHFASRLLDGHAGIRLDRNFLTLATSDRQFGEVTLDLGDQAQVWAASLRRLAPDSGAEP
ncbi:MAG: hypothetical protein JSS36_12680 [Proteobacteria bacterium]|nr:hypothetical protein [Pseudomonadota bacterium]